MAKVTGKIKKKLRVSTEPLEALHQNYEDGKVAIYDGPRKIWEGRALPGDAFVITFEDGKYTVNKLRSPHRKNNFLMWVFGFSRNRQFDTEVAFARFLSHYHGEHLSEEGYQEYQYGGEGYCFVFSSTSANPNPRHVAAWVSPTVNRQMAKEILSVKGLNIIGMGEFGDDSLSKELSNRFGFCEEDFNEIHQNLFE